MSEELMVRLVEELWASFGYDTPEDHAKVIYNLIAKELIGKFLDKIRHIPLFWVIDDEDGELGKVYKAIDEIRDYYQKIERMEKENV